MFLGALDCGLGRQNVNWLPTGKVIVDNFVGLFELMMRRSDW